MNSSYESLITSISASLLTHILYPVQCRMTSATTEVPSLNITVPSSRVPWICTSSAVLVYQLFLLCIVVPPLIFLTTSWHHKAKRTTETTIVTRGWSHILLKPGCLLVSSDADREETWTSLATGAMSLQMSVALAALPIRTTTWQQAGEKSERHLYLDPPTMTIQLPWSFWKIPWGWHCANLLSSLYKMPQK